MTEQTTEQVVFSDAQQELVNKLVGEARTKAREKATVEFTATQEADTIKAAREQAAAAQEWEKLAGMHAQRVAELEPYEAQVKAYGELIAGMLKDRVKTLGEAAKTAVAGLPEGMSDLDKLNWLNQNGGLFEAVEGDGVGTPRRPKVKGKQPIKPGKISKFPIKL